MVWGEGEPGQRPPRLYLWGLSEPLCRKRRPLLARKMARACCKGRVGVFLKVEGHSGCGQDVGLQE